MTWDEPQEAVAEHAVSHRAGHGTLLLSPVPEPDDSSSRLGIKGSACEVVGGACLQQKYRTSINLGILWGDYGREQSKVSPGCRVAALP